MAAKGEIAVEARQFTGSAVPGTEDKGLALFGRFEGSYRQSEWEARVRGFGRADYYDPKRNIAAAEEAFVQYRKGDWRVRLGADIVNWSATEAFHPADTLNARNFDSDIESFEKIGEPMLAVQWTPSEGTALQLFLMPFYLQSAFPSPRSRLNFAAPGVNLQGKEKLFDRNGQFTDSRTGAQAALRLMQTIGKAELSLYAMQHMDKLQPMPALDLATGQPALVFQTTRQAGITYQQAFENGVLAKLETAYTWFLRPSDPAATAAANQLAFATEPFPNRNHSQIAGGFEYTIEHGWGSSTLILEAEAISGVDQVYWPTLSFFPRDVLFGYRLAFSTADSRAIRAAYVVNWDQPAQKFFNLAYEQRIGDSYTLRAGYRAFAGRDVPQPIGFDALARGDHVFVTLVRHF